MAMQTLASGHLPHSAIPAPSAAEAGSWPAEPADPGAHGPPALALLGAKVPAAIWDSAAVTHEPVAEALGVPAAVVLGGWAAAVLGVSAAAGAAAMLRAAAAPASTKSAAAPSTIPTPSTASATAVTVTARRTSALAATRRTVPTPMAASGEAAVALHRMASTLPTGPSVLGARVVGQLAAAPLVAPAGVLSAAVAAGLRVLAVWNRVTIAALMEKRGDWATLAFG